MYDIISGIIGHTWESNYGGEQQYIYYIAAALIVLLCCTVIDLFYRLVRSIFRKGDF